MKTGRNIIIGAILALGVGAGAITPAVAAATPAAAAVVAGPQNPGTHFYGAVPS